MNGGKITRRSTVQWVAAAIASLNMPSRVIATPPKRGRAAVPQGYGRDPDLLNPTVPWAKSMSQYQLRLIARLADLILPGTESAPAPSLLGIADFVDEWISAPYPDQQSDRSIILEGLTWVDAESHRRWQRPFVDINDRRQKEILGAMSLQVTDSAEGRFFKRLRFIVVGGYYSTPEGFKDIGYIGNVALLEYPPIKEQELAILEAELHKLGI